MRQEHGEGSTESQVGMVVPYDWRLSTEYSARSEMNGIDDDGRDEKLHIAVVAVRSEASVCGFQSPVVAVSLAQFRSVTSVRHDWPLTFPADFHFRTIRSPAKRHARSTSTYLTLPYLILS